jgi:DNA polymerase III delta prime subunit
VTECISLNNSGKTEKATGTLQRFPVVDILPGERRQEAINYIRTSTESNKQILSEDFLAKLGETYDSLVSRFTKTMKAEIISNGGMMFVIGAENKDDSEPMAKIASQNGISYFSNSLKPHDITRLILVNQVAERNKAKRLSETESTKNRIYVLAGPTCSGKTITALKLKERLGNAEIIGNIKPGSGRPGEDPKDTKDIYIDPFILKLIPRGKIFSDYFRGINEDAIQALTIRPYSYDHFGNRYHLLYPRVIRTLKQGKDVILLSNLEGLEKIKEMKEREGIENSIISYLLIAPQEVLEARLKERLDDSRITAAEFEKRKASLNTSLEEYIANTSKFDRVMQSNKSDNRKVDVEERISEMMHAGDEIIKHGTVEFKQNYVASIFKRLTKFELADIQRDNLIDHPINLDMLGPFYKSIGIDRMKAYKALKRRIITSSESERTLAVYMHTESETEEDRKIFLKYLEYKLGTPFEKNDKISNYPASLMGKSKLTYPNGETIKLSDVALYKVESGEKKQLSELAIVMVENYNADRGRIITTELKKQQPDNLQS